MECFENLNFSDENRLFARTLIIPAEKEGVYYRNKTDSERIKLLNGTWKYSYFDERRVPDDCFDKNYDDSTWDEISVPSDLNVLRYGMRQKEKAGQDPCGIYRVRFYTDKASRCRDVILHFDGVRGAFCIYVNGSYAGCSRGSCLLSEFDITPYLKENGENVLCVQIWEDLRKDHFKSHSMIAESGIFRDVFLIYQNRVCLWDYEISTTQDSLKVTLFPNRKNSILHAEVFFDRRTRKIELYDTAEVEFRLPSAQSWNAEDPYLYDLKISVSEGDAVTEIHSKHIGLRESKIIDGLFCVNGTPVVLQGITLYDFQPYEGSILTEKDIEAKLKFLKACNFNAIRTVCDSMHPAFYELCNEMGFYIVNETTAPEKSSEEPCAYSENVRQAYTRNKNETCIVIWSVCGDCKDKQTLKECTEWLRKQKNERPVMQAQDNQKCPEFSDFRQYEYSSMENARSFADMESEYPAIAVDYRKEEKMDTAAFSDIWDIIDKTPQMQGGFISENVCIDNGVPASSMNEIKYLMSPLRIREQEGKLSVYCRNSFTRLDSCTMLWNVTEDGIPICDGLKGGLNFGPGETAQIDFPANAPVKRKSGAEYRLNIMLFCGERDLGYAQILLAKEPAVSAELQPLQRAFVTENDNSTFARLEDVLIRFDNGMLSFIESREKVLLDTPMELYLYGADSARISFIPDKKEIRNEYDRIILAFHGKISDEKRQFDSSAKIEYTVLSDGSVLCAFSCDTLDMRPYTDLKIVTCFSERAEDDVIHWLGRGWQENRPGQKSCTLIGLYEGKVPELSVSEKNTFSEGWRCDTRFVSISEKNGTGLLFCGIPDFSFSVREDDREKRNHLCLAYSTSMPVSKDCVQENICGKHPCPLNFKFSVSPYQGNEEACQRIRKDYVR